MTKVDLVQNHQNGTIIDDVNVIEDLPVLQVQVRQVAIGIGIEGGVDTGQRVFPDPLGIIGTDVDLKHLKVNEFLHH